MPDSRVAMLWLRWSILILLHFCDSIYTSHGYHLLTAPPAFRRADLLLMFVFSDWRIPVQSVSSTREAAV
jgi:hypothetical protein